MTVGSGARVQVSNGLNDVCPGLVHDNALGCFYANTHKHTSRPPRLQLVSSALSVVDTLAETRQLNSPGSALQTHECSVTIMRLAFVEK